MQDIILLGAGGHALVVKDIIQSRNEYNIVGVVDKRFKKGEKVWDGIHCLGSDEELENLYKKGLKNIALCIGGLSNLTKRADIYISLKTIGYNLPILLHENTCVSKSATIGEGTCVMPFSVINANAHIGKINIINTLSVVEHDCNISDNVHISPRACVLGGVTVGKNTHIGAGAVVNQTLEVGENVVVGSGAVVTKNILANKKVMGVPAQ
ncbi:MAG: serine acetyltransferase [Epulopiscium sp. Nuni2H_MBin003]|nr:MAG: serine acetyltransferase [Epulopiscium sp. Nuni2H_MBin003]